MTSETLTIRMEGEEKRRLEALAEATGRSRSHLAADAIRAYLDVQEWQVEGVRAASRSLAQNGGVAHEDVKGWVASWDSKSETKLPKPAKP